MLSNTALSLAVPVVGSIWLSIVSSFPEASLVGSYMITNGGIDSSKINILSPPPCPKVTLPEGRCTADGYPYAALTQATPG